MLKKPKTISIIGGLGQMGQKFVIEFKRRGYKVLVSGISTNLTNREVATKGDIIIVTVPISKTERVIKEIVPFIKKGAMLTDFTSVKMLPMKQMGSLPESVGFIGGHPLFGPTTDFKEQNFILCVGRKGNYFEWYKNFLSELGLKIIEMTADEHDRQMAIIQSLTHFSALSLGSVLQKTNCDLSEIERISTPVYLMRSYGIGRILAQNPSLYTDIQAFNPYAEKIIQQYKKSVEELATFVQEKRFKEFYKVFNKSKRYFGKIADKSLRVTDKLIKTLVG